MPMSKVVPIVRAEGEGEKLWFYGGGVHTWLATSAETGGAFLLFDDVMTRGKTTPMHSHPEVDETLYVLMARSSSTSTGTSRRSAQAAWQWSRGAFRTPSWSHRSRRACWLWRPQAPARLSIAARARR